MKMNFTKAKALVLAAVLAFSALLTTGCVYRYKGEYPELCSVAWANIPTARGYISMGEIVHDANLQVLQRDEKGRTLFAYSEENMGVSSHLLIMQKSDGENAYYYPEDCYIFITHESGLSNIDLESEEILALKAQNDWDLPINESKCESTKIVTRKPEGKVRVDNSVFEKITEEYCKNPEKQPREGSISFSGNATFITSDKYGRELYVAVTVFSEKTDKSEIKYYYYSLIVMMPDDSFDASTVIILEDVENPQSDVKRIKAENGWNTPLS